MIDTEKTKEIIRANRKSDKDTGSSEVQIALLTARINELTEHFKIHVRDHGSKRGLLKLVGRRRRLLEYVKRTKPDSYKEIITRLGLRR